MMLVYKRDASWYNSPQQDKRIVYHRANEDSFAVCSSRIFLNDDGYDIPEREASLLCKRCFPKSDTP